MPATSTKELWHHCGACQIGRHDICVTLISEPPTEPRCTCAQEGHTHTIDPIDGDPVLTGHLRRDTGKGFAGGVRDVDYDLEPYETRTASETGATKSKPRGDLENAQEAQRKTLERAAFREHYPSQGSPF